MNRIQIISDYLEEFNKGEFPFIMHTTKKYKAKGEEIQIKLKVGYHYGIIEVNEETFLIYYNKENWSLLQNKPLSKNQIKELSNLFYSYGS